MSSRITSGSLIRFSGNFHLLARQGEEVFVRVSVTGCEKKANQ